jgi:hypothetical protein
VEEAYDHLELVDKVLLVVGDKELLEVGDMELLELGA